MQKELRDKEDNRASSYCHLIPQVVTYFGGEKNNTTERYDSDYEKDGVGEWTYAIIMIMKV
jgi:hypothetical protein